MQTVGGSLQTQGHGPTSTTIQPARDSATCKDRVTHDHPDAHLSFSLTSGARVTNWHMQCSVSCKEETLLPFMTTSHQHRLIYSVLLLLQLISLSVLTDIFQVNLG